MDYIRQFVVRIECWNIGDVDSNIFDGFFFENTAKYIITSGHAAGYKHTVVLTADGKIIRCKLFMVGNMDMAVFKLETDLTLPHFPKATTNVGIGDKLTLFGSEHQIETVVTFVEKATIQITEKGPAGAPVFTKDGLFAGFVRGNSQTVLPAFMVQLFLKSYH